jgi:hypothetical protein
MTDQGRLDELSAAAQHARQRYSVYKARVYGPRPSSMGRLRTLERDANRAEDAAARAQGAIAERPR